MKRAKPKKKNPHITIPQSKLERIKYEVTKDATDRACLILLCAAADELKLDEDEIVRVMKTTDLYARHVDNHLVRMEDIRKSLENNAGISLKGWV